MPRQAPARSLEVHVDGVATEVSAGTTVAALLASQTLSAKTHRSAWCAMGVCYGCQVTIDGCPGQRACLRLCEPGMELTTRHA